MDYNKIKRAVDDAGKLMRNLSKTDIFESFGYL